MEWEFRNNSDSSSIMDTLIANFSISSNPYDDGPWIDTISNGKALVHMYMNGDKEELLSQSPMLTAIIRKNEDVLTDTSYSWINLEFIKGKNQWENENQNVSRKKFYITNK